MRYHIWILMIIFLTPVLFGMKVDEGGLYKQCAVFENTDKKSSPLVDVFFLPEDKNKIVVAYASGLCNVINTKNKKVNKEAILDEQEFIYVEGMNDIPGKVLQNVAYHDGILYAITNPHYLDLSTIKETGPFNTSNIQQWIFSFKKEKDAWVFAGPNHQFVNSTISHSDPAMKFVCMASTVSDFGYSILKNENGKFTELYPKENQRIQHCIFSKNLCAMVTKCNSALYKEETNKDTFLTVISTSDWKPYWQDTVEFGVPDLIDFSDDGALLASCSRQKNISIFIIYDSISGKTTKFSIILQPKLNSFSSMVCRSNPLRVCFLKKEEDGYLVHDLSDGNSTKVTDEECDKNIKKPSTIIRYSDDLKRKIGLQNNRLVVYKEKK